VAARLLLLRLRHERIAAEPGEKRLIRVGHAPRSPEAAGTVPMAMHTQDTNFDPRELIEFIVEWLKNHIIRIDRQFGEYAKRRNSGLEPT